MSNQTTTLTPPGHRDRPGRPATPEDAVESAQDVIELAPADEETTPEV